MRRIPLALQRAFSQQTNERLRLLAPEPVSSLEVSPLKDGYMAFLRPFAQGVVE